MIYAAKLSNIIQTYAAIKEVILVKSLLSAVHVDDPLHRAQALRCTGEFILGINHLNVVNVEKGLGSIPTSFYIKEFTLEKNPLGVVNVGRLSVEAQVLFNIE